jgi:hypothetical protein
MTHGNDPDPRPIAVIDARTQGQIDDYARHRSTELTSHFALVSAAALQSSSCHLDDNPAIVRGTD